MSGLHTPIEMECLLQECGQIEPHNHGFQCTTDCHMCTGDCGSACDACNYWRIKKHDGLLPVDREVIKDHHNGGDIGEAVYIDGELASIELDNSFADRVLTGTYKGFRVNQTINN